MNHKFLKNLKLFCKYRRDNYEQWLKAYKIMPDDVKKKFKADLAKEVNEYRKTHLPKRPLDKTTP